jgi:2,3-bisphosphoglycerate-dependent phosphoglycerate mutase
MIRHTHVEYKAYDQKGKFVDISSVGWNSAVVMANDWNFNVDEIFTSPLNRCIETILPLSLKLNKKYKVVDDLQELDYMGNAPDFHKRILVDRNFCYKDGETIDQANSRFEECVLELAQSNSGKTIVLSTHGTVLSEFLINRFNFSTDYFFEMTYPDIYKVVFNNVNGYVSVDKILINSYERSI